MQPSLAEMFDEIAKSGASGRAHLAGRRYKVAQAEVRQIMAAASRLYARLGFLGELEDDAHFVGEVDRALQRERQSRGISPIPGDTVLPFPPSPDEASPEGSGGKRKGRVTRKGAQTNQRP